MPTERIAVRDIYIYIFPLQTVLHIVIFKCEKKRCIYR